MSRKRRHYSYSDRAAILSRLAQPSQAPFQSLDGVPPTTARNWVNQALGLIGTSPGVRAAVLSIVSSSRNAPVSALAFEAAARFSVRDADILAALALAPQALASRTARPMKASAVSQAPDVPDAVEANESERVGSAGTSSTTLDMLRRLEATQRAILAEMGVAVGGAS